jgi:alpha-mannosidase
MRFALEHQDPLIAAPLTSDPSGTGAVYPAGSYSFVELSSPDVLLWALKPAEDGVDKGIIARLWNLSSRETHCQIALQCGTSEAWQTTHIETDLKKATIQNRSLQAALSPQQFRTYRLLPTPPAPNTR